MKILKTYSKVGDSRCIQNKENQLMVSWYANFEAAVFKKWFRWFYKIRSITFKFCNEIKHFNNIVWSPAFTWVYVKIPYKCKNVMNSDKII